MIKLLTIVGTRPNIIKITQFEKVLKKFPHFSHLLVHTGQHYHYNMSDIFFSDLNIKAPDAFLEVDRNSALSQIAQIMQKLEKVVTDYKPHLIFVTGDVNSTLAGALVANKMGIRLAHIESGLRSFDKTMPEENNRMLTDAVTDMYFVTEESGVNNLLKEGKEVNDIYFVGNTMIDTLVAFETKILKSKISGKLNLKTKEYALMTMHRPACVDTKEGLLKLIHIISEITKIIKIVFPCHPRTVNRLKEMKLHSQLTNNTNTSLLEPVGYLDFQNLILNSKFVITDSGGIQEETTFRKIPCITLRPNTERPITTEIGSNTLIDFDIARIVPVVGSIMNGKYKKSKIPPLWDGKATERIFEVIEKVFNN